MYGAFSAEGWDQLYKQAYELVLILTLLAILVI